MSIKSKQRSFFRNFISGIIILLILFSVSDCTLELTEQAGEIRVPVSGLWIAKTDEPEYTAFLYISSPGSDGYPFRFTMLEFYKRWLLITGRRIYATKRTGVISSSPNELLLYQDEFESGFYNVKGKGSEPWALSGFSRFISDRHIKKKASFVLLRLSGDGHTLEGWDFPFERSLRSENSPIYLAETEVGLVQEVYPDQKTLRFLSFSPAFSVVKARRKLWKPSYRDGPQKGAVSQRKQAAFVEITRVYETFGEAVLLEGRAEAGDLLVMPRFRPDRPSKRRRLSKEEVLRRIQRGEHVPREDLIRVLGKQNK